MPRTALDQVTPRQFCSAIRSWLDGVAELDAPLAAVVELLARELADEETCFVSSLRQLAQDGTDARQALGADTLLRLWEGVSAAQLLGLDQAPD
ncbi:MAG: hypothetical protein JO023_24355 [Chloroflexi bacterium]|nr:hypothetical protein [Chloroflexota bacterium]